jgi:MoaA/NifB/PqqE/SkfB family radical SAM enzyme
MIERRALHFKDPASLNNELSGRLHLVMTWKCNYTCSYCFQNGLRDGRPVFDESKPWSEAFARLPGRWMVTITGGEPLLYPRLPQTGAMIASAGHSVTLVTNLSASTRRILEFTEATGNALRMISASWHPEHISLDLFAQKIEAIRDGLQPGTQIVASLTLTPSTRCFLPIVRELAEKRHIPFLIRDYREDSSEREYVKEELEPTIESPWLSHRPTKSWFGVTCTAGMDYFVVDSDGLVYRCLSDLDSKFAPLGDFLGNFVPTERGVVCPHHTECCLNENHRRLPTRSWIA